MERRKRRRGVHSWEGRGLNSLNGGGRRLFREGEGGGSREMFTFPRISSSNISPEGEEEEGRGREK